MGSATACAGVPAYDGTPSDHELGPPFTGGVVVRGGGVYGAGAGAGVELGRADVVGFGGRGGAAEVGLFVTSGFDGDDEDSPGDEGRLAPPLATARAAAESAAEPEEEPEGTGRVGSLALGVGEESGFTAGFVFVVASESDETDVADGFELTLGEASVVIGAAPPPGFGRDVVPGR